MEKGERVVARIYGYAVCLVAVVVFLSGGEKLVQSVFDLAAQRRGEDARLSSFERYKLDVMKSIQEREEADCDTVKRTVTRRPLYVPDDKALRAMYEAEAADASRAFRRETGRTIVGNGVTAVLCVVVVAAHWRWMGRSVKPPA